MMRRLLVFSVAVAVGALWSEPAALAQGGRSAPAVATDEPSGNRMASGLPETDADPPPELTIRRPPAPRLASPSAASNPARPAVKQRGSKSAPSNSSPKRMARATTPGRAPTAQRLAQRPSDVGAAPNEMDPQQPVESHDLSAIEDSFDARAESAYVGPGPQRTRQWHFRDWAIPLRFDVGSGFGVPAGYETRCQVEEHFGPPDNEVHLSTYYTLVDYSQRRLRFYYDKDNRTLSFSTFPNDAMPMPLGLSPAGVARSAARR